MCRADVHNRLQHYIRVMVAVSLGLAVSVEVMGQSDSTATVIGGAERRSETKRDIEIENRVRALVRKMTLAEKIGQMQQANTVDGDVTGTAESLADRNSLDRLIRQGQLGSILNDVDTASINRLQTLAVEESRLGVPLIFGRDVIHGFRTIFPIPLGQAASWNPALVEQAAAIAAREARSVGIHWTFAPMIDIARDPRWGRIAEGFGEDPYLASVLSAAAVRGFQGPDLSAPDRIAACAKHLAGYGAAEGGRDYNTASISPSLLRNVYLPPFRAAVDAGAATLMTSFNDVNGVPSSANAHLLREVLRNEWKFRGFVVSDWTSIEEMIEHGYSRDEKDAARAAVSAGVNMEMVSQTYHNHLAQLIKERTISEATVDELVAGVLRVKIQLGLFENPYVNDSQSTLLAKAHLDAARQLARQSVVLLKNKGQLLPLDPSKIKKLAVIGPLADAKRAQLGTWIPDGREEDSRTTLAALRETAVNGLELLYAPGLTDDLDRSQDGFNEAVAAARQADVVLLFVGEGADISGEAHSRAILDLPGAQDELVDAVAAAGKPIVLIAQAGRPLTIGRQIEKVESVLYSFHAGTMAGPAIADLLWGRESPSGKLPVTFPKAVGQIPLYYNHMNTGRPPRPYDFTRDNQVDDRIDLDLGYNSNYIDVGPYPLFPFGYGLSYTTFEYSPVELSTARLRAGQILAVRAPVTNTGDIAAEEVVQLYVRDVVGSLVRPVRELKAFRRVRLNPGETKIIEFSLAADDLAFFNNDEVRVLEPGKFELYLGGSSLAPLVGEFELVQ
jgi:beta-glucosidase